MKLLTAAVALMIAVVTTGPLQAGGCYPSATTYSQSYYTPTYYSAPSYGYQSYSYPSYSYQAPTVIEKQVIKEVPVPYVAPIAHLYYGGMYSERLARAIAREEAREARDNREIQTQPPYEVPQSAPQAAKLDQILTAVNGLGSRIDNIDSRLRAVENQRWAPPEKQPEKQPQYQPEPAPPEKAPKKMKPAEPPNGKDKQQDQGARLDRQEIQRQAVAFYNASCSQCHDAKVAKKRGGDFILLKDGRKVALTRQQKDAMVRVMTDPNPENRMPPKDNSFKVKQPTKYQQWLVRQDNA